PEVTSSVVVCDVRKPPFEVDEDFFFKVVRTAFAQRRKTLLNSLACFGREKLLASGIDVKRRAETLSLEEFAALATALQK
ncbi:MAG: 16S rRNA (adenine(1518)-N(6)/adenine(1519)-N(6))-dimethyltransferase, partial [Selenomonadaceae bacterium]|nr:16S rRNA (adenine(1518)-N(6)/adenine(1519)-N(6))-dimethyltransferase [Selenomonadaceae bacterium]